MKYAYKKGTEVYLANDRPRTNIGQQGDHVTAYSLFKEFIRTLETDDPNKMLLRLAAIIDDINGRADIYLSMFRQDMSREEIDSLTKQKKETTEKIEAVFVKIHSLNSKMLTNEQIFDVLSKTPDNLKDITRKALINSNQSFLDEMVTEIINIYLEMRNKQIYASFPREGNKPPKDDESTVVRIALKNCRLISELSEELESDLLVKTINELQKEAEGKFKDKVSNEILLAINDMIKLRFHHQLKGKITSGREDVLKHEIEEVLSDPAIKNLFVLLEDSMNKRIRNFDEDLSSLMKAKINLDELVTAILGVFWYPKIEARDLIPSDSNRWKGYAAKYNKGAKPRNNDLNLLSFVIAEHINTIICCFPHLNKIREELIAEFVNRVAEDWKLKRSGKNNEAEKLLKDVANLCREESPESSVASSESSSNFTGHSDHFSDEESSDSFIRARRFSAPAAIERKTDPQSFLLFSKNTSSFFPRLQQRNRPRSASEPSPDDKNRKPSNR